MPEPTLTQVGGWIYDALRPIAEPYDAARGYPSAVYADAIGGMLQPVYDIVNDADILLDPDRTPVNWLPWLGQFVGQTIQGDRLPLETDAAYRARITPLIKDPPHRRRGTVPAIVEEVQAFLVSPKTVYVAERQGGSPYIGTIGVIAAQYAVGTTLAAIQARVNAVAPVGRIITVSNVTGIDWQTARDVHTDWTDIRSQFADWAAVKANPALT